MERRSKYLDCQKNIRNVRLAVVAEEVNTCYETARLSAFKVKYIWVEIRERWKTWIEIVNCFDMIYREIETLK